MKRRLFDLPSCEDERDVKGWLRASGGVEKLQNTVGRGVYLCLNGNDGSLVMNTLRNMLPRLNVDLSEDGSYVMVRKPQVELEREEMRMRLYGLDTMVMNYMSQERHRMKRILPRVQKSDWERRHRGTRRSDRAGAAGEVLLDALVDEVVDTMQANFPHLDVASPISTSKRKRAELEQKANGLLRKGMEFEFHEDGCYLYDAYRERREYENAIAVEGEQGPAFLFLDATVGKAKGKYKKTIFMRDYVVHPNNIRQLGTLSVVFGERLDKTAPYKLILPGRHSVEEL